MNQTLINSLIELEVAAAHAFWNKENRGAWRDDLLRQSEARELLPLKRVLAGHHDQKSQTLYSQLLTWDPDLRRCFGSTPKLDTPNQNMFDTTLDKIKNAGPRGIAPIYLRPGFWMDEQWTTQEADLRNCLSLAKKNDILTLRCGFLTQEADIYLAADLGFSAVQIHAQGLDLYELQLAIELARDCRLSPIISAATQEEIEQAIQTDAPHIALCYFPTSSQEHASRFVQHSLPKIPDNCTKILLAATAQHAEIQLISRLGFDLAIQFNPSGIPTGQ